MAQAAAAEEKKKGGFFSGWFAAKPAHETISTIANELKIIVEVSAKGDPKLTFQGDSSVINKLVKALKSADVEIPDGYLRTSVTFTDKNAIDKVTAVLDRVKRSAKSIIFEPLKPRATEAEMDGLNSIDMYTLRQQANPSIEMVGSIVKLGIRDKTDRLRPARAVREEPIDLAQHGHEAPRKGAVTQSGTEVDDDMGFTMNTDYKIRNRNGLQGGLVVQVPASEDEQEWKDGAKELREALGDSGVATVQLYHGANNKDVRGYIIAGIPTEKLVSENDKTVSKDTLKSRIRTYIDAQKREVAALFPDPEKVASFGLPATLPADRKESYIKELQAAFGADGDKYVLAVHSSKTNEIKGFKVLGATKEELQAGGSGSQDMKAKITEMAEGIREELKLADRPDLSKSVSFWIPNEVKPERKQEYIKELQALFPEHGDKLVTAYRSRNVLDKDGVRIVGVTREELMNTDEKMIGNNTLVRRMQAIMKRSKAQVVTAETEQTANMVTSEAGVPQVSSQAATEADSKTPADVVKAFMNETRSELLSFNAERRRLSENAEGTDALGAVEELTRNRKAVLSFPKDSKMLIIKNIGKELPQMEELREAFQQGGFPKTHIVGVNNLYIDLTPGDTIGNSKMVADGENHSPENKLRELLSMAYRANEVDQMVANYNQRNAGSGLKLS